MLANRPRQRPLNQTDSVRLTAAIEDRLRDGQDDLLFTGGCCFHFALCAYKRGLGAIAYTGTSADPTKKGRVFVITEDGRAFDHNGYSVVSELVFRFSRVPGSTPTLAVPGEIEAEIERQCLPGALVNRVSARANELITRLAT